MIPYTLKQLEIFLAVVDTGSFSHAAEKLYLNQSTVSAHISALENALNVRLFDRSFRRQAQLTEDGKSLYPRAKAMVSEGEELLSLFLADDGALDVPLGASTVPGLFLLPECLPAFMEKEPGFRYNLKIRDSAGVHEMMQNGEIHVGFVGAITEPDRFDYYPLKQDSLVMVTPNTEKYRRLKAEGAYGRDLVSERTIARENGSGTDRAAKNYLRSIGFRIEDQNIIARMDDPESIKRMIEKGTGVSILSSLAVQREVETGQLLAFDMDRNGVQRDIYMTVLRGSQLSCMERKLTEFILEYYQEKS